MLDKEKLLKEIESYITLHHNCSQVDRPSLFGVPPKDHLAARDSMKCIFKIIQSGEFDMKDDSEMKEITEFVERKYKVLEDKINDRYVYTNHRIDKIEKELKELKYPKIEPKISCCDCDNGLFHLVDSSNYTLTEEKCNCKCHTEITDTERLDFIEENKCAIENYSVSVNGEKTTKWACAKHGEATFSKSILREAVDSEIRKKNEKRN